MIITKIQELDKKRSKIYLDGEFAFTLYKSEIRKYELTEGETIKEASYLEIDELLLPKRAKLRAMNLLMKKTYTQAKLREKLLDGCYHEKHVDFAIEYVKSYGYINDENFARDYIEYHKETDSKQKIKQKLIEKGIAKNLILDLIEELCDTPDLEREQVLNLFQKKYKGVLPEDLKERNKMMQYFLRKGYSISCVKEAIFHGSLDEIYNL